MMPHCPNMNDTPSAGPLTGDDFRHHEAGHAATEVGADHMPDDGKDRWLGARITVGCALVSLICAGLGLWLRG